MVQRSDSGVCRTGTFSCATCHTRCCRDGRERCAGQLSVQLVGRPRPVFRRGIRAFPGFMPYGVKTYGVRGHLFRLALPAQDKKALIAFLRTL